MPRGEPTRVSRGTIKYLEGELSGNYRGTSIFRTESGTYRTCVVAVLLYNYSLFRIPFPDIPFQQALQLRPRKASFEALSPP
jgi:hypothetical protein